MFISQENKLFHQAGVQAQNRLPVDEQQALNAYDTLYLSLRASEMERLGRALTPEEDLNVSQNAMDSIKGAQEAIYTWADDAPSMGKAMRIVQN